MQDKDNRGSLAEKFGGFGSAPSEGLWNDIEAALDEKKKRRGIIWWWLGSGLAAVITISVLGYHFYPEDAASAGQEWGYHFYPQDEASAIAEHSDNQENEQVESVQKDENSSEQSNDTVKQQNNNEEPSEPQQNTANVAQNEAKNEQTAEQQTNNASTEATAENNDASSNTTDKPLIVKATEQEETDQTEDELQKEIVLKESKNQTDLDELMSREVSSLDARDVVKLPLNPAEPEWTKIEPFKRKLPWEVGVNYSFYGVFSFAYKSEEIVFTSASNPPIEEGQTVGNSSDFTQSAYGTTPPLVAADATKRINIHGFAGKYFKPRWAWRSGLNYSRSAYLSVYEGFSIEYAYTNIHSVSIPLSLRADVIQREKFRLIGHAGIFNEFTVVEKSENYFVDGSKSEFVKLVAGYGLGTEVGLDATLRLSNRLNLQLGTSYRTYLMQNIKAQNTLLFKRNWFGASLGVVWRMY